MENDLDIHKSHPPRRVGLFMFHCFNISKHISISVPVLHNFCLMFVFFLLDCFIITCYALFLKSDWLVALLFLLKKRENK